MDDHEQEAEPAVVELSLPRTLAALDSPEFARILQEEVAAQADRLPLQEHLRHTDRALTEGIRVVPLHVERDGDRVRIKAGIFYQGILAGSCCADDPTPVEPQQEYCEVWILI